MHGHSHNFHVIASLQANINLFIRSMMGHAWSFSLLARDRFFASEHQSVHSINDGPAFHQMMGLYLQHFHNEDHLIQYSIGQLVS